MEQNLQNLLQKSESYGVMLDEYTDVSAQKQLALVTKFLDCGESKWSFLQNIQIPNGEAETIYSSVKDFLTSKNISLSNLTSVATDKPGLL